ncbi:hypothetical protein BX661DRAFT_186224 [Kickxella alabastrina]|uniref:uncharacterized protein n=1 Tax=Kickxella alabastrina TaxID=61397 RepID=UPI00222074C6|nr:uncharacterized protein BX661DRAFT_186224 [Kickxella alabastrina]KAI7823679.1 hypothetical protein BX661DRAFT_186224 [Kickxella alabastrina]KAJ1944404.1 squalene synthetase-like protein [Kickxella alabastrina]
MDDLFVIDTKGSTEVKVTTTAEQREFTVTGTNTPTPRSNGHKFKTAQIRVIEDDLVAAAPGPSTAAAGPSQHQSSMNGLNLQFLKLGVGKNKNKPRRQKNAAAKRSTAAAAQQQQQYGRMDIVLDQMVDDGSDDEIMVLLNGPRSQVRDATGADTPTDQCAKKNKKRAARRSKRAAHLVTATQQNDVEAMDDYMQNLGEDEIMELLQGSVGGKYQARDIGGPIDLEGMYDEPVEIDDPFKYDDELGEMLLDGSDSNTSDDDEDDGCPVNLDLESLAGPDEFPLPKANKHHRGRMQSVQNAKTFKDQDRAKAKNSHAKQKQKDSAGSAGGNDDGPSAGFDPRTIIKRLDMLTQTSDMSSIWLQPMNKYERQVVHMLAREYSVKSKSHGNGARRTPVLTLTAKSNRPTNRRRISRLVMLFDEGGLMPEQYSGPHGDGGGSAERGSGRGKGKNRGRGGGNGKGKASGGGGAAPAQPHGKIVAEDAPVIGSSNVGHRMLAQMGWQPGQGLGVNEEGRSTPVDVMFRAGRRGLGA